MYAITRRSFGKELDCLESITSFPLSAECNEVVSREPEGKTSFTIVDFTFDEHLKSSRGFAANLARTIFLLV